MSSPTHIYIVVGSCADGSVVLVHSSPAGVRLTGTPDKKGRTNSEAVKLATTYTYKEDASFINGVLGRFSRERLDSGRETGENA